MKKNSRITDDISQFTEDGFEILSDVLAEEACDALANELTALHERQKRTAGNKLGGLRNLLKTMPAVAELANSAMLKNVLHERTNRTAFPVRALFFDKTADANWKVAWHQDLTIAVTEKIETPGFTAWSVKEEIIHVQPAVEILKGMTAIRLHLDDCNADNGALKVVPGSHLHGKLNSDQIKKQTIETNISICEVAKGGALLMRPLLLHSSSQSQNPSHRRVIHIEYATSELPSGLKWFDC